MFFFFGCPDAADDFFVLLFRSSSATVGKKGRDNFKQVVKEATDPEKQLPKERIRKFAARARAYICTYYYLAKQAAAAATAAAAAVAEESGANANNDANDGSNNMFIQKQQLLFSQIERLMKAFKVHRCALDFDRGFVNAE